MPKTPLYLWHMLACIWHTLLNFHGDQLQHSGALFYQSKDMYGKERTFGGGPSETWGCTHRAPVPVQTLSRAHNRLLRLTPSWSTKARWKQAKQTKKQVIIPLLFLLIFLLKYQTLYYILVFGGRTGRKRHLPDDCPTAEHGTESFLDATEGQWARNLVGRKQVQVTREMSTSFSEATPGYLHLVPHPLPSQNQVHQDKAEHVSEAF